jgi:hypothetical protein
MTDRLVTLTVWILAAGFALACVVFAWRAAMPGAAPPAAHGAVAAPGEPAWRVHCARCHAASEFTGPLAAPDRATVVGRWLMKLERHGDAPFADDVAIVHWLAAQAAGDATAEPAPPEAPDEEDDFTL